MNYIVFDLEWNQGTQENMLPDIPLEIVEIGAVKLNERFEKVATFHRLINPKIYLELNDEMHKIVPLSIEELQENGVDFAKAAESFFEWCGQEEYRFCVWGDTDLTELQRNLRFFQVPIELSAPVFYYNIQKCFGLQFPDQEKRYTLEEAVSRLDIPITNPFHRALEDAEYTAAIVMAMDKEIIKAYYSVDRFQTPKTKEEELYLQFPSYTQYISREFYNKIRLMKDKEISSIRCYKCNQDAKRKIRWYAVNGRSYDCLAYCRQHGYIFGRIRIRKTENGRIYADKMIKQADKEEALSVWQRREELREKRRRKKKEKRDRKKGIARDT
ncbi:MAG: exonuclease domain-containing protein [Lachnospiraceae bacterium]|nr:exonuclease domain-containing protein [Lachnospiraceae bacterium]